MFPRPWFKISVADLASVDICVLVRKVFIAANKLYGALAKSEEIAKVNKTNKS